MNEMIEMRVKDLFLKAVLLEEVTKETNKVLAIGIDPFTMNSIIAVFSRQKTPRPSTHDLMQKAFEAFNIRVDRIEIVRLENEVFIGNLVIIDDNTGKETSLDSRPSDGIALALRFFKAKILVAKEVLDEAGQYLP